MINFNLNGFEFTAVQFDKGVFTENMSGHSHAKNSYELHYIIDGTGTLTTDTKNYSLKKGDFFVTGPNVYHQQSTDNNNPLTEIYVYIQTSEKKTNDALVSSFLATHFYFTNAPELESLFRDIIIENKVRQFGYQSAISSLLQLLLTKITRLYVPDFGDISDNNATLNDRRFFIIENAFISNPKITLATLSELIGVCERQTQRLLIKYYGKTFKEKRAESRKQ